MKVKLNCIYGDNLPDTVVDLKKEVAEQLIKDGNAFEVVTKAKVKDAKKSNIHKDN